MERGSIKSQESDENKLSGCIATALVFFCAFVTACCAVGAMYADFTNRF